MVNQLGKFVPNLAEETKPIRDLIQNNSVWSWVKYQQKAFEKINASLVSTPVIRKKKPKSQQMLHLEIFHGLKGALLQKQDDDVWKPVCYISRTMASTETRYAQI